MTDVSIWAGELHAAAEPRTHIATLLKWGEVGDTSLGRFAIDRGSITIPRSPEAMPVNYDHDDTKPVARITKLEDREDRLLATIRVADTDEGDRLEAEIASGVRNCLSVDVADITIHAGRATRGRLYGAAFVPQGAFPSAVLHAQAADTAADDSTDAEPEATPTEDVIRAAVLAEMARVLGKTPEELEAALTEPETSEPETSEETEPASEEPTTEEPETPATNEEENAVAEAAVPQNLAAKVAEKDTSLGAFYNTLHAARAGDAAARMEVEGLAEGQTLHAAITDIKYDTNGSLGSGVVQPKFLGELWSGRRYERRFIPVLNQAPLTALENKGWRFVNKPSVQTWAGNKTEISGSSATVESYTYKAQRYAHAVDIAREFYDFNETGVIERFLELVVDSYAEVSDNYVLNTVLDELSPTALTLSSAQLGTRSPGIAKILQGIRAVDDARGTATFAAVAPDVFDEILLSQDKDKLQFVSGEMGLNSGTIFGLNFVRLDGLAAGQVLVGDKNAVTVEELAGSPIRVNAIDLLRGGYDEAIVAYIAARIDNAHAIALVADAEPAGA
ncbi:hypothetical protein DOE76_13915 [Leifsonia sp. ku-ls]|nr:hypothetical protein DOE76_13915 [Leifsonia sp. ku-ls]